MFGDIALDSVLELDDATKTDRVNGATPQTDRKDSSDRNEIVNFEKEYRLKTETSRDSSGDSDSFWGPKKRSRHSDFYYKLEALNEKIKVYKEVFYSRENYFIGNKRDPKYQNR